MTNDTPRKISYFDVPVGPIDHSSIDKIRHLLVKLLEVRIGGHDAWTAQTGAKKIAIALVLNKPE